MAKDGQIKLSFEMDKASEARVKQSVSGVESQFVTLQKSLDGVAVAADRTSQKIDNALKRSASNVKTDIDAVNSLRDAYIKAADAADKVKAPSGSGNNLGRIESLTQSAGRGLSGVGLGGLGGGFNIGADVLQSANSLKELQTQISELVKESGGAIPAVQGLAGSLAPLAPFAVIAAGVTANVILFTKVLEEFDRQTAMSTQGLKTFSDNLETLIKNTSGTSDEAVKSIEDNQKKIKDLQNEGYQLQKKLQETFNQQVAKSGDFLARVALSRDKTFNDAVKRLEDLNSEIDRLRSLSNDTFAAVQSGSTAAADAQLKQAEKAKELAEATKKAREEEEKLAAIRTQATIASAEDAKATEIEKAKLYSMSTQQSKDYVKSLENENNGIRAAIDVLVKSGDTSKDVQKKIDDYNKTLDKNSELIYLTTKTVQPLIAAREAETKAAEDTKKKLDEQSAALKARNDQLVAALQKRDQDIEKIQEDAAKKQTDIAHKYYDDQVAIAQKFADDVAGALTKLNQQREELSINFGREEQKAERAYQENQIEAQIAFYQNQQKAAQDHARELAQIARNAKAKERDLLLDRNFLGLFQQQEQTKEEIANSNESFEAQQKQAETAFKQQQEQAARQYEFERRERLISYQQANQDAQRQYQRELELAREAQNRALQQAANNYNNEIRLAVEASKNAIQARIDGAKNELSIINQTEQAKAQIFATYLQQAQSYLSSLGSSGGSANPNQNSGSGLVFSSTSSNGQIIKYFDKGGSMRAGQIGVVNDGRNRESFNGAMLPNGMGLFMPLRDGSINPNGGGKSVNFAPTINITGGNPEAIGKIVEKKVYDAFKAVMGD